MVDTIFNDSGLPMEEMGIDKEDYLNSLMNSKDETKPGELTMVESHELIRVGNYDKFPGAVERLSRSGLQN